MVESEKEIEDAIMQACSLADKPRTFSKNSRIYPFATERISGYLSRIDLKGKKVLSVAGSGDHLINSYLLGASDVVVFDINKLSLPFIKLKIEALKKLDLKEFERFFFKMNERHENHKVLSEEGYKFLKDGLDLETTRFFDMAYSIFDNGYRMRNSGLFEYDYETFELNVGNNNYLQSSGKYQAAQKAIQGKNLVFLNKSVQELTADFPYLGAFDAVLLSNISDYAHRMFPENEGYLTKFAAEVISPLNEMLNEKGTIVAAYIYQARPYCTSDRFRTDIDNPEKRFEAFGEIGLQYSEIVFDSVLGEQKQDAVVILQK